MKIKIKIIIQMKTIIMMMKRKKKMNKILKRKANKIEIINSYYNFFIYYVL
jgi:hypothetical protein